VGRSSPKLLAAKYICNNGEQKGCQGLMTIKVVLDGA